MNNPKRILMIADSDSIWTKQYLEYLLLPAGYEVVLFPIWGNGGHFDDFYRENGVTVYCDTHTLPLVRYIPRVRMWARIALNARDLAKLGPFDAVHDHYLSRRDLALGERVAKRVRAPHVCSFWGSDLLRASKRSLRRMAPYLRRCHAFTLNNELGRDKLRSACGEALARKAKLQYLGITGYAAIDSAREKYTRDECRAHFGIAKDRFVLCVGYSASSAQQQLQVLKAMQRLLPKERYENMTLVLQHTYCENDADYVARTHKLAAELPCQTVVLTKFMGPEESAMLRLAADLFVLAITTDAFSASMQEYLYAGACVIKAAWLGYPQLDAMGISLPEFGTFDQIPELIARAMDGELTALSPEQRARFSKLYSWQAVREQWLELYE